MGGEPKRPRAYGAQGGAPRSAPNGVAPKELRGESHTGKYDLPKGLLNLRSYKWARTKERPCFHPGDRGLPAAGLKSLQISAGKRELISALKSTGNVPVFRAQDSPRGRTAIIPSRSRCGQLGTLSRWQRAIAQTRTQ
jgi:hypothetical protein